ncbi:MAG: hypothetical protein HKN32_06275, partial [Flavobacteriales bacterium]|nr:hypothetical protein [Flavobacteriales bacterium]
MKKLTVSIKPFVMAFVLGLNFGIKNTRKMKKSGIITLGLASTLMLFTACQKDSDEIGSDIDALELESDAALETT